MIEKKVCRYCGREFSGLAHHILKMHPSIVEQLEEIPPLSPPNPPINPPVSPNLPGQNPRIGDISGLIKEKLDIMLNIKIIEMLSKSPATSIQEISAAINPPQSTPIDELAKYHDLVYGKENMPYIETGNQWVDVAQQAIPLIREMLPKRQKNAESDTNVSERNTGNSRILKPIQHETSGDTGESGGVSQESGIISHPEQQNLKGSYPTR